MKKKRPYIAVIAACVVLAGCGGDWKCGSRREAPDPEKNIIKIKKRIAELEKSAESRKRSFGLSENYYNLGNAYMDKQLFDAAIDSFVKSVEHGKKGPSVYYSLGLAYANRGKDLPESGDLDRAETYFKKALDDSPGYYHAKYSWAIMLFFSRGEKERALEMMEEVAAGHPKDYRARFALGRFYYEMNRPDSALGVYEELRADLEKLADSPVKKEYLERAKENITRIGEERGLSRKRGK